MTHDASFELDLLTGFNVTRSLLMIIITENDDVMRRCVECIYHVVDSVMRETLLMIPVLEQSTGSVEHGGTDTRQWSLHR